MITLKVKKQRIGPVIGRHPWLFSQALAGIPSGLQPGDLVRLVNEKDEFLANGYFNSYSQLCVRIWSHDPQEVVDGDFFTRRVKQAAHIRNLYIDRSNTDSWRLINSENDLLPGLVVDKYADYLVIQCHTRGIEVWKKHIIDSLIKVMAPKGIYEKSDSALRKIDGSEPQTGVIFGEVPELVTIRENGYKFLINVREGQKTGFFLDQREKRKALQKYAPGLDLLNCFSYTGGFSVYALAAGAKRVASVDTSAKALEIAKENIKLNNLDINRAEFICKDVKQYLRDIPYGEFGLIILDPPAFIKDRKKKEEGIRGYKGINEAALKTLKPDGILVTCSCSTQLALEEFRYIISEAAGKAGQTLQLLETYTHGPDHPELISFTEGNYLKCFFGRVV